MKPLDSLRKGKMNTRPFYFGLIFIAIIAILANYLGNTDFSHHYHISALIIAILLGMAIGNTIYPQFSTRVEKGVLFAKGTLLRTGIVLYGFRLTFGDIADVGLNAVVTDAIMLISTFFFTALLGIRYLKMDKQLVYLTGAGCSICGAAAVMAAEPVTKAESHKVSVAIAVVVIFGTLSIFTYPFFYTWSQHLINAHQFGIYVGSSVHEVAQVYAIGGNIDPIVANTAVISKMIRVMMLAPFLLMLSWLLTRSDGVSENTSHKITIPWFAVLFIGVAIFNSFDLLPKELVKLLVEIDSFLLISAMAALGLTTQASAIKKAGLKPLILGILIYLWLVVGGFLVNYGISKLI
jgi:predicted membrane protein